MWVNKSLIFGGDLYQARRQKAAFRRSKNFFKYFFKNLLTNRFCFVIICRSSRQQPNIGASPSGKASDSDSDISGVRIPVPQPQNPTRKSWIFSFVPIGTTSFAWHTQHHLTVRSTSLPLAAQMNEVVLRTNDVATSCKRCDASHQ